MKSIFHVLNRCLVTEFYKQNAAFFGLVLLVFFGFIKASEHIRIASFFVADPWTLLYVYGLYLIYAIKVLLFIWPTTNKKENRFLGMFLLLPPGIKIFLSFQLSAALLLPIITYSVFLIFTALKSGFYYSVLSLVIGQSVFLTAIAIITRSKLNKLPNEKSVKTFRLIGRLPKMPFLFFIEYVLRNDLVLFLLTKLYVCLVVIGTEILYKTDDYDLRLLAVGVLLAFVGNVALMHKFVWFQHHIMSFTKNLPISHFRRIGQKSAAIILLLLPEFIVLIRYFPGEQSFFNLFGLLLFGFGLVFLLYGLLLTRQYELSDFLTKLFWIVVITTFLILFSVHPFALGLVYFVLSFSLVNIRYHRFEYIGD